MFRWLYLHIGGIYYLNSLYFNHSLEIGISNSSMNRKTNMVLDISVESPTEAVRRGSLVKNLYCYSVVHNTMLCTK